jgi:hypothetical protein
MLLGYDIDGRSLRASGLSQLGHVFGQDDSGPSALIRGYVERGPGFDECMAKRAWASFTGLPWDTALTDADRAAFIALSRQGPRPLIQGILTSPVSRQAKWARTKSSGMYLAHRGAAWFPLTQLVRRFAPFCWTWSVFNDHSG